MAVQRVQGRSLVVAAVVACRLTAATQPGAVVPAEADRLGPVQEQPHSVRLAMAVMAAEVAVVARLPQVLRATVALAAAAAAQDVGQLVRAVTAVLVVAVVVPAPEHRAMLGMEVSAVGAGAVALRCSQPQVLVAAAELVMAIRVLQVAAVVPVLAERFLFRMGLRSPFLARLWSQGALLLRALAARPERAKALPQVLAFFSRIPASLWPPARARR